MYTGYCNQRYFQWWPSDKCKDRYSTRGKTEVRDKAADRTKPKHRPIKRSRQKNAAQ